MISFQLINHSDVNVSGELISKNPECGGNGRLASNQSSEVFEAREPRGFSWAFTSDAS